MIRRAERRDIPALMEIYNDAVWHTTATFDTEARDLADREAWFEAHTGRYILYVWEEHGSVAGYASLSRYRERRAFDPTVESSIYIHRDYRGQGSGTALMRQLLGYARECGEIRTVVALITSGNEASIRLHEEAGFVFRGRLEAVAYKFGKWLGLDLYQLELGYDKILYDG